MNTIHISRQPIELYKLLKIESLASSGGEAKQFIADGLVKVNGEAESRKRRKMIHGDIIEFDAERYRVICDAGSPEPFAPDAKAAVTPSDADDATQKIADDGASH